MHFELRCLLAGSLMASAMSGPAWSDPPRINTVDPPAVERGVANSIQIVGAGLSKAQDLHVSFEAEVSKESSSGESARFSLKPAPSTPPGVYPLRVRTSEGMSNLRLIEVTHVPVIRAKEPNGGYKNGRLDLEQAQRIQWPAVLAGGRIERDLDLFRFSAHAGERLTLVTETRRLGLTPDPLLRLRDGRGRTLTYAHDTPGLMRDERIDYTFDQDGEYFLELESFGVSGWNNHYVAKLGAFDYARSVFPLGGRRGELVRFRVVGRDGEESTVEARLPGEPAIAHWQLPLEAYPGSLPWNLAVGDLPEVREDDLDRALSADKPSLLSWPVTVNGRIGKPSEEDLYRIAVTPGEHVRVQVEAYQLGSALDGYLMVYDPVGKKLLAAQDDQVYRGDPDPGLSFQVPAGLREVVICLRDGLAGGGVNYAYRLTVERGGPDFYLWLGKAQDGGKSNEENESWFRMDAADTLNLPVGEEVKLRVSVRRSAKQNDPHYRGPIQGYQGPIYLRAEQAPPGVMIKPTTIPAGQVEAELTCIASADAPLKPFEIAIVGEGTREDGSVIRRVAERKLFTADPQMTHLAWNWRVTKVTCVATRKTDAPTGKLTDNIAK